MESNPKSSKQWAPGVPIDQKKKGYLVKLEPLEKLIECALISPYIKNEKPISLLICASPESGKTAALKQYSKNKGVIFMSDITAHGLNLYILPKIVTGEVKTIMIPDLLTPLSKQTKTRRGSCSYFCSFV